MSDFKLEAFLNPNLALGSEKVAVAFTVSGKAQSAAKVRRVVGLVIDTSGSMGEAVSGGSSETKIVVARHAARVFVDTLSEDTEFFIIGFADKASLIVPRITADTAGKRQAHEAIKRMNADGRTFISSALTMVRKQFEGCAGAVCMIGLMTDGDNNPNDAASLKNEIGLGRGVYQAHCRGFGTDWKRALLQPVSDGLLGTIGLVADNSMLSEDFRSILDTAMSKSLSDLRLRIWMPKVVSVGSLKQMFPAEVDITSKLIPADQRTMEVSLGAWGDDSQDYQGIFTLPARAPDGLSTAICKPSLVFTDPLSGQTVEIPAEVQYDPAPGWGDVRKGVVEAAWSDDASLTMRVNRQVEHYAGEGEKSAAKQEFAEAWDRGDEETATLRLRRVMELAEETGDEDTKRMVRQVSDVDPSTGTLTLRRRGQVSKADVMNIEVQSTRTVRARRG